MNNHKNTKSGYFDYAAATPILPEVLKSMQPYFSEQFHNPSSIYLKAKKVKADYQEAVASIARELGCRPTECIITAGGTEANNLAIQGVLDGIENAEILVSVVEHDSVLEPAKKYNHKLIEVNKYGVVDLVDLKNKISENTVLISVQYVNNEVGAIQPIKTIVALVAEIRQERLQNGNNNPILVHTDACQAVNYCDINVSKLGVDLMTINSGKIYGPKQCGLLYVKTGLKLTPIILGGGQQYGMRSGTENVAYTIGFAKALQIVRTDIKDEVYRLANLQQHFTKLVEDANNKITINGPWLKNRVSNNIHITIDGIDNERLVMELDEKGFIVATGSACSASNDEPSHVLRAMGISEVAARSSIRITMGRYTTKKDCQNLINNILTIAKL